MDTLVRAAELKDNAEETVPVIRFMSFIGTKTVFGVLTSLVSHGSEEIKLAALEGLDKFDFPQLANTLLISYKRESDDVAKKVLDVFRKRKMVKESVSLVNSIFKKNDEVKAETVTYLSLVDRNELKRYLGGYLKRDAKLKERVLALFREHDQEQLAKDIESAAWEEKDGPRREERLMILSTVFLNRFNFTRMLGTTFQSTKSSPPFAVFLRQQASFHSFQI